MDIAEVTNLLITGSPRSGKTTLVKKILKTDLLHRTARGFFTEEFRQEGQRIGFFIKTVPEGKKALLSKKGLLSSYKVGQYGIDLKALEELGCQSLRQGLVGKNIIVVDEIGKMELYSEKFRLTLIRALDSHQKVFATIMQRPNTFCDGIKNRLDVRLLSLNRDNFGEVFQEALTWLDK